ncbi:MAG: hypothetical protein V8R83_08790 [Candidatus Gastranaerophilaceae bacterium]
MIENDTTTDGTGGTDGTDGSENTTGTIPDYDKSSVLNSAGLLADYTNNTIWQSEKVNRSGKSQEECRSQALAKSSAYAESVLSQVESTLIASLVINVLKKFKNILQKLSKRL